MQKVSQINAATYVGKGKVEEIKQLVGQQSTDLVIFDDELSPVQLRNLEKTLGCKLLDRSALILDIFAQHARTATAKTQVELAQLEYLRTRLTRHWTHLSRQKGGIGTKGPGETQIETDRRMIGQRISTLKTRLEKIDRQRTSQRKGRAAYTRVSLVGYTNAGKSTLMNAVAKTSVLAEDKLFATLDSTTRTVFIAPGRQILILTHGRFTEQMQVVDKTLAELDVKDKPTLLVFNKIDAIEHAEQLHALHEQYPEAAFISAERGIGLTEFRKRLLDVIEADFSETIIYLPIEEQRTIAHIRKIGEVLSEEYMPGHVEYENEIRNVVRLHFRTAPRYERDVKPLIARYRHYKPVSMPLTRDDEAGRA